MTNNSACYKESNTDNSHINMPQIPVQRLSRCQVVCIWGFCFALVVIVCLLQVPKYATPDDFMQDLYARGEYFHTPGYLMLYSSVPFSALLCALYQLLPNLPWYPIILFFMIVASFVTMHCLAWQLKVSRAPKLFLAIALICCEIMSCVYFTYTVVAFLAFAAGIAWIVARGAFIRPSTISIADIGAYILLFEGFSLRPESGLSAAVMFAPFIVWALIYTRNKRTIIMAAAVVGLMALSYISGYLAWNLTDGWQTYNTLFSAARAIADYPSISVETAMQMAPNISGNDLAMLYEFCFVDSDVFSLQVFEQLGSAVSSYSLSSFVSSIVSRKAFTLFIVGLVVIIVAAAYLLVRALRLRGSRRIFMFTIPCILLLEYMVVYLRGRALMQVILPLFVIALFAVIAAGYVGLTEPVAPQERNTSSRFVQVFSYLGIAVYIAVTIFIEIQYALPLQRELKLELTSHAQHYVDEHPTQDVLFTHTQGILTNYDVFTFETWAHPDNAIFFGGYEQYTPAWQTMLAERGLTTSDGFIAQRLLEADAVSVSTSSQAEMVRLYLEEHTGYSVKLVEVENLGQGYQAEGPIYVWSYEIA